MKITLVGAYPPPWGGIQTHLVQLRHYLEQKGHECFIINLGKNKELTETNLRSPRTALEVAKILIKQNCDVIHLHFGGKIHLRLKLLTLFCCLLLRRPAVVTIHSGGLPHFSRFKRWGLMRIAFLKVKHIICVNPEIAKVFIDFGIPAERCQIIPAFAFKFENPNSPLTGETKEFLSKHNPVLTTVGLLEPEYDLSLLIRTMQDILNVHPKTGLYIIGSGSLYDRLKNEIKYFGLEDSIFLTGDYPHEQTIEILRRSNCYIRATLYDGDCLSIREAQALGIPVVASNTGMRPMPGTLFEIGNQQDFLEKILGVLADKPDCSIQTFEFNDNLEEVVKILEAVKSLQS